MEVEWSETALTDTAGLDKGIARRVKQAVERFAENGTGNTKRAQNIARLSSASAAAITVPASRTTARPSTSFACREAYR